MKNAELKNLLSKLVEEQAVEAEKTDQKVQTATNINQAAKTAFSANNAATTTSKQNAAVKEDPAAVVKQHLLSAYKVIKANPQMKLGKITTAIKAFFDAQQKEAPVKKSNAALVTKNADGTTSPVGQAVAPAANGPAVTPPAQKAANESMFSFMDEL